MERLMMQRPESDDVDFKDVFGGPPRRFSMAEVRERHSFGESSSSSSWEKPVFGEEKRRQKGGADFFDDIFKGSPRRNDPAAAVFGSNPGSRIMSPARPTPDHLASSLPAQFSLPAKLTKSMDLPTFGSQNESPNSWSPFSRFSNGRDEVDSIGNQFHFSIYKWAGRGVPMLMPLVIGKSRSEKSATSNGTLESKSREAERGDEDVRSRGEKLHDQNPKSKTTQNDSLHAFLDQPEMKDKKVKKGVDSNNAKKVEKAKLQKKSGKVKEFVQIFNQDAEVSSNQAKLEEQVNLHNVNKKPDVSFKKVENVKINEARLLSPRRMSSSIRSSSKLRKSFSAGTLDEDLKMSQEKLDDPLEDNFEVHEISDGNDNIAHDEISEETKAIDAKIRQWSVGKKGNIRSLLSTLQYVLWAESGWKAVPLVDLIESNSVKKAYQKALLRLHPDKLQQKGADFHHKYTAEKVFDILQEAWDHFNTSSSLGI